MSDYFHKIHYSNVSRVNLDEIVSFHRLHDFNNDNRLDGLEILASLRHSVKDSYARAVSRGGSDQEQTARADKISQRLTRKFVDVTSLGIYT